MKPADRAYALALSLLYVGTSNIRNQSPGQNPDPDVDGVANLLEFATGADPTESSMIETPVSKPVAGNHRFTYTRNKLASAEAIYRRVDRHARKCGVRMA